MLPRLRFVCNALELVSAMGGKQTLGGTRLDVYNPLIAVSQYQLDGDRE